MWEKIWAGLSPYLKNETDKDYLAFYHRITAPILGDERRVYYLKKINQMITLVMYALYPLGLLYLLQRDLSYFLGYLCVPALSFISLSLIRKGLNQKRPYEEWAITPLVGHGKLGESMPSRHVFSASLISMSLFTMTIPLGMLGFILTMILASCRVLAGVHYPKDVLVGAILGVLCGSLLYLF